MSTQWAMITGASSGLGVEFAKVLASRGLNVVLVARRAQPMEALAEELRAQRQVQVRVVSQDLAAPDCVESLAHALDAENIAIDVLVNNAAFGMSGSFITHDPQRIRQMLELDIVNLAALTHHFGRRMAQASGGYILLVASLAAYQPVPLLAAYSAAKAFVLSFGEALHVELAPKVGVTVACPGLVQTEFFAVANFQPKESMKRGMLPASVVAERSIKAMFARKPSVVIGRLNRISAFATRLFSRNVTARIAYRLQR